MLQLDLCNRPIRFSWRLALALFLPTMLAVVSLWPVLDGGHLADDYNLNFNLDKQAEGIEVLWAETLAEFTRPFLDSKGWPYFRPLASLSISTMLEIFGANSVALHALNLFHHAIITLLTALMCALYARRNPEIAALVGGSLIAIHPVAVEPIAWWSAYTSSQAALWTTLACTAFALHRHYGYRLQYRLSLGFAVLAVLSKETATALPIALLGLDLLHHGPRHWKSLIHRQLGFAPIWILYIIARSRALDGFLPGHDQAVLQQIWNQPSILAAKLHATYFPFGELVSLWYGLPTAVCGILILLRARRSPQMLFAVLGLGAWVACMFAPSFTHQVQANLGGSRVIYVALPIATLAATYLVFGYDPELGKKPITRIFATLFGIGIAWCMAQTQAVSLANYQASWAQSRALERDLQAAGQTATPHSPIAILNVPETDSSAPLVLPTMIGSMLEKPYAAQDMPYVDLTVSHINLRTPEGLEMSASPVRAMLEFGAQIFVYQRDQNPSLQSQMPAHDPQESIPQLQIIDDHRLRFEASKSVSSLQIEALELQIQGLVTSGTLSWRSNADAMIPASFRRLDFEVSDVPDPDRTTKITIDLSGQLGFLDLYRFGKPGEIQGFDLSWPAEVTIINAQAIRRVAELQLATQALQGKEVVLGKEKDSIRSPMASHQGKLRCILLTPIQSISFPVPQDYPLKFSAIANILLDAVLRLNRQHAVYYYFQDDGAQTSRSQVDWFTIVRAKK